MATRAWRPTPEEAGDDWKFLRLLAWLAVVSVFIYGFAVYGFVHLCGVVADKLTRLIP